jgi:cysteine desulfurase
MTTPAHFSHIPTPAYFDHNATSPVSLFHWQQVWAAVGSELGNASSPHTFGRNAHVALTTARRAVALALQCDVAEVVFTSGGSEGNVAGTLGVLEWHTRQNPGQPMHVVLSPYEHPCVRETLEQAKTWLPLEVTILQGSESGSFSVEHIKAALKPNTVLVSCMAANNETGATLPVQDFGNWLHAERWKKVADANVVNSEGTLLTTTQLRGLHFHVDGVQAFGKLPPGQWLSVGFDSVAVCGHKLGGVPGGGALVLRRGRAFLPRVLGGPQEKSRRAGTENIFAATSLGILSTEICSGQWWQGWQTVSTLRTKLEANLSTFAGLKCNTPAMPQSLPNTLNYCVVAPHLSAEDIVMELDMVGLCLSTGSACSSGVNKPSHTLLAMGRSERDARNALRISLAPSNTEVQVEALLTSMHKLLSRS